MNVNIFFSVTHSTFLIHYSLSLPYCQQEFPSRSECNLAYRLPATSPVGFEPTIHSRYDRLSLGAYLSNLYCLSVLIQRMVTTSIQDRTAEFRAVVAQAQRRLNSNKAGAQRQSLLTDAQRKAANGSANGDAKGPRKGARSEFARRAAEIGRGITGTMEKLERLAQCMWTSSRSIRAYGLKIWDRADMRSLSG